MSQIRSLFALLAADTRERLRRPAFLATVVLVLYLGYAVGAGQILIKLQEYRGVFNSAWVGSLMALAANFVLGFAGFFLVKNSISRDIQTGVGQILAASALRRGTYLFGKWLGNFLLLALLIAVLALAAAAMVLLRHEVAGIEAWPLLAPFLLFSLPVMAVVAGFAVLFETGRRLRSGAGNLAWFVVFALLLWAGVQRPDLPWLDLVGFSWLRHSAGQLVPGFEGSFVLAFVEGDPSRTFRWPGFDWTPASLAGRLWWIVAGALVALAGLVFFRRFDSEGVVRPAKRHGGRRTSVTAAGVVEGRELADAAPPDLEVRAGGPAAASVMPARPRLNDESQAAAGATAERRFHWNVLHLLKLEILLLLKGLRWYWLVLFAALWLAAVALPPGGMGNQVWMLCALAPVLLWSRLGIRDLGCRTTQLVLQTPFPVLRQTGLSWLAGLVLSALALAAGPLCRILHGEDPQWLAVLLAVLFIPSLALCLGQWCRTERVFEFVYPVLWYIGPFNTQSQLAPLDFLGVHDGAPAHRAPALFVAVSAGLLVAGLLGSWWNGRHGAAR